MPDTSPMNVVFVITDQQRYDSLGCTGNPAAVTPHLDALAAEGTLFERHITANPVCMPSRSCTMTGCYPSVHGVWTNGVPLPRADHVELAEPPRGAAEAIWGDSLGPRTIPSHLPTMADTFAAAGYRTASVGKLHLTPTQSHVNRGYEESQDRWNADPAMRDWHGPYFGFQHVDMTLDHGGVLNGHYRYWLDENHPEAAARARESVENERRSAKHDIFDLDIPAELYPTTWVGDRSCDLIDQYADAADPFFMWVGIPDPHHPFTPPAETARAFAGRDAAPVAADPATTSDWPAWVRERRDAGTHGIDPDSAAAARRQTDAMVHLIDEQVGKLVAKLKERGLWERTVFVFTSDHGDFLGDYGLIRKCDTPCRVLNNTPLLMHAPGMGLPARCANAVSNVDMLPTLAGMCGVPMLGPAQGEDIRHAIANGRSLPVMVQARGIAEGTTSVSVFDDTHRLSWHTTRDRIELFDHRDDPMELKDLADLPAAADRREDLLAQLQRGFLRATAPNAGRISTW